MRQIMLRLLYLIRRVETLRQFMFCNTNIVPSPPSSSLLSRNNSFTQNSTSLWTSTVTMKKHEYPPLDEKDLYEDFVQGSGPGGQSVNRTMNCVVLKHLPSGVVIKCHESRSLEANRRRARERLQEKLDFHYHREESYLMVKRREESEKMREKKRRSKSRLEKKKAFKEREGLSEDTNDT